MLIASTGSIFLAAAPAFVSYAGAAVAVLALLITLGRFLAEFPRLGLEQEPLTDENGALLEVAGYHDGIVVDDRQYVRARVRNKSLLGVARDTQVLAYVEPLRPSGYKGLDVRPLRWASAEDREGGEPVSALDIPPGVDRHVDLIVCEPNLPQNNFDTGRRRALIRVAREPSGKGHVLPAGSRVPIKLIVACEGRRAASFQINVIFDGIDVRIEKGPHKRQRYKRHHGRR